MPKVLGLVGSQRRLGNSEVLVKEALEGAREEGAETALLRLTDLAIKPCTGCMACVFKDAPCEVKDDVAFLFETMESADAVVLGAPTYFLGASGVIKILADRVLMRWLHLPAQSRPAATIVTAGLREWEALSQPALNQFLLAQGYEIMGSLVAYAPGPGQSLLNEENVVTARALGKSVARGEPLPRPADVCPVCYARFFEPRSGGRLQCPICRTIGTPRETEAGLQIDFDSESLLTHRWTYPELQHHIHSWVIPSKDMFLRDLSAVKTARERYKSMDHPWLKPPDRLQR
ncbi:MAG: flavodoxin family protein [Chloroflexi bacterium]|nr:flavodoxin family protein [Chloroflexota bacterium]